MIGALQAGQAERGTTRLKRCFVGVRRHGRGVVRLLDLRALLAPLALHHDGYAVDDHVEEAAYDQAEHEAGADEEAGRRGEEVYHGWAVRCERKRRAERGVVPGVSLGSDDLPHLEDRQVHGDDQAADQHAQHHHDEGLEQARHRVHGVVDLGLVERGDFG